MSAHLARAELLLAQSRPADAERELLQALAADPENPVVFTLLALSQSDQRKNTEAFAAATRAVGLAPDWPHAHYVHARVLHHSDRDAEAEIAIAEAIRLDPLDADHFALRAAITLARRDWPGALAAAEEALALHPEHVGAANLRAMALVRLGRKTEAAATVDFALHRAPDNAFSHANQGWNRLHQNDPKKAQEHFREALRLEPDLAYAREGMLEALKARNPIYRAMLAYFLWLGRQSARFQWAFIIGAFFGRRAIDALAKQWPALNWLWWPLLAAFYVFVYLSWTAGPMFNLLLLFDRFGRHVLSRDERRGALAFGVVLGGALAGVVAWLGFGREEGFFATVTLAALSICVAATFGRHGKHRAILGGATAVLALIAGAAALMLWNGDQAGVGAMTAFVFGFVGFQLLANVLATK